VSRPFEMRRGQLPQQLAVAGGAIALKANAAYEHAVCVGAQQRPESAKAVFSFGKIIVARFCAYCRSVAVRQRG
jgi:hypothetical protein